ncbi:hypothetical protein RMSM_06363 [Rhodopirellula maiorica SM1]|uniref:Uncharacterized protein n=1 Tax=Rhodopirellula maiorica SM1 TaxID=1265738 RepID=M5RMU6_9BACT|nr:hypothetical protein RMSM_06363 [Rhodopirellula maiorica SM1]
MGLTSYGEGHICSRFCGSVLIDFNWLYGRRRVPTTCTNNEEPFGD